MDSSNPSQTRQVRALVRAMAWRSHFTETETESAEDFEAWLATDAAHREAWRQVQEPWDALEAQASSPEMLALRRQALANASAASHKRSRRAIASGWKVRYARAAAVAVLLAGVAVAWIATRPDVYRTAAGEHRTVTLDDGSTVILDSLSEVRVAYSGKARELSLARGQAHFDVARDVERPFSVRVNDQKVVAMGTAFNIDRLETQLVVTLLQGAVVVLDQSLHRSLELRPGEQLLAQEGAEPVVSAGSLERAMAWRNGLIIAENEPLAQLAERISRYSDRSVETADPGAAALRVNGVFKAGDVGQFVATMTEHFPLLAEAGRGQTVRLKSR